MAVTFTTNIGLAKPSDSELAENWVNNTQLQEDNNLIIEDKTDVNLTAYTPVFAATTTAPSVGAGTLRGEYQDIQGFVCGSFVAEFTDPGVSAGVGEWGVRLPFIVDGAYHVAGNTFNQAPGNLSVVGEGYIFDAGTPNTSGTVALDVVTVGGFSYVRLVLETFTGKTSRLMSGTQPFVVVTTDRIAGNFFYKRA